MQVTKLLKMQERIMETLEPGEYKKIDDVRIDLCVSRKNKTFDRAWRELILCGKVDQSGNSIKANQ